MINSNFINMHVDVTLTLENAANKKGTCNRALTFYVILEAGAVCVFIYPRATPTEG
jgi:hypothetical protein